MPPTIRLFTRCGLSVAVAVLLMGCLSYPRKPYQSPRQAAVVSIAIIPILPPEEVRVIDSSGTAPFGLIGDAIEAGIEAGRNEELRQRTGDLRTLLADELSGALVAELQRQGYSAVVEGAQPPAISPADFEYDYTKVHTRSDAVLHVWSFDAVAHGAAGYMHYQHLESYQPRVFVCARLVNPRDDSESYFQAFSYGPDFQVENIEYVSVSPNHVFASSKELLASSRAAQGLLEGVHEVGVRVGQDLAKP